jgi:hypothetical protein
VFFVHDTGQEEIYYIDIPWMMWAYTASGSRIEVGRLNFVGLIWVFKGTVSRDFLLLVFFLNQFPPSL